jgi:hypothetical protein
MRGNLMQRWSGQVLPRQFIAWPDVELGGGDRGLFMKNMKHMKKAPDPFPRYSLA